MSSTSWAQMARPRPVPPKRRVVELSAWEKGSSRVARADGSMPMPVSATRKCTPSSPSRETPTVTPPCSVNLTAFPTRLTRTWRRRSESPVTQAGTSSSMSTRRSSPLAWAWAEMVPATLRTAAPRSKSTSSMSSLPASILEKSRMSLMRPSRLWPDSRRATSWDPLGGVELAVEQHLGQAQHAVHRGADLVAHGGDEGRLQPGRLLGLRQCRGDVGLEAVALGVVLEAPDPADDLAADALGLGGALEDPTVDELQHVEALGFGVAVERPRPWPGTPRGRRAGRGRTPGRRCRRTRAPLPATATSR